MCGRTCPQISADSGTLRLRDTNLGGRRYTRAPGGDSSRLVIHAKRDVVLEVITAIDQPGIELPGWKQTDTAFTYSDGKHTRVVLLQKQLTAGEELEIPRGNWS